MKRWMISLALLSLLVAGTTSWAQMGEKKDDPGMKMGEGQQMSMMQMCMPMMQDMMKMMMEIVKMQEKIMMGPKAGDRKRMMKEISMMKERMQNMMAHMGMMMGMGDSQARLKCAEEWLKRAIDLYELHMKDPKTTTEASQMELMNQIKKAYECIKGGEGDREGRAQKAA